MRQCDEISVSLNKILGKYQYHNIILADDLNIDELRPVQILQK